MIETLENFDRRIAKIVRDRLKLPSPMTQFTRELFHEYIKFMTSRCIDDLRDDMTPLLDRVDFFEHDRSLSEDDWTLLVRLRFDRDYETHAKLRGHTRLSDFIREIDRNYRTRMLERARGGIPKRWRDRLRSIAD